MNNGIYASRESAGKILAELIDNLQLKNPYLVAIPRGGIQVAEGIADKLQIPIHPIIVKKLPVPSSPETGFGAITEDGVKVLDPETLAFLGLTDIQIDEIAQRVIKEIHHRTEVYGNINKEEIRDKDIIVADDGAATGYSLIAALKNIKNLNPSSIIAAIPVSSDDAYQKILQYADKVICPMVEKTFYFAVGSYYEEWYDLTEEQIKAILREYSEKYAKKNG